MLTSASPTNSLAIRLATRDDEPALRRLAALDSSQRVPSSPALIAEVDGRPAAAISMREEVVVSDPFQRTAEIVDVLRMRVAQIRPRRRARRARALRPAVAY